MLPIAGHDPAPRREVLSLLFLLLIVIGATSGCAIHYYDAKTQTEHIWGIGHMKMKVAPENEGLQAIVRGTDVWGVSVGHADKQAYFTLGWHRVQTLDIVTEGTAVRLEWPTSDFVDVRVGSQFPGLEASKEGTTDTKDKEKSP